MSISRESDIVIDGVRGIIHVGASFCQELNLYLAKGVKMENIIWIEAQQSVCETVRLQNPDIRIYNVVASDVDGKEVDFIVTNNSWSSSILELGEHKGVYPGVIEHDRYRVTTVTLDSFMDSIGDDMSKYNFANIDVQGAELMVLKGMTRILGHLDYMLLEINATHMYEKCALVGEIDAYLTNFGFERSTTNMIHTNWGEALYVRVSSVKAKEVGRKIT